MNKLVSIVTDPAIGGTFLSWSLEYLAGHTNSYSTAKKTYLPMVDNPVQERRAHGFKPNRYDSSRGVIEAIDELSNLPNKHSRKMEVMYLHSFNYYLDKHKDWFIAINAVLNSECPVILVRTPKPYVLYHGLLEERAVYGVLSQKKNIDRVFADKKGIWNELNLSSIYDTRERIALNFHPFVFDEQANIVDTLHNNDNVLNLLAIDVWQNLDNTIYDIMNYIQVGIKSDRYVLWLEVYNQWKTLHTKRVMWCWYYDQIIEYILNGYSMDLTRFDLDIYQEATIQHTMMFKYNLNFKTFELTKFTNTKQLHDLLEPNIHSL
jgi:hypothetical protein